MTQIEMTENTFRTIARDALKRNEFGIYIWENSIRWRNQREKLTQNRQLLLHIASELQHGRTLWVNSCNMQYTELPEDYNEEGYFKKPSYGEIFDLAVPTARLIDDDEYCQRIVVACELGSLKGPFTTLPSMHLSSVYFNPTINLPQD